MGQTENLSVKKTPSDPSRESAGTQPFSKLTSTWTNAYLEFFASMLEAGADATRTFVKVVDCEKVTLEQFPGKLVNGVAESNVTFFQRLSDSSRRFNDAIKSDAGKPASDVVVEVDYERLARMVAEELRKQQ
jgi:capsid protein